MGLIARIKRGLEKRRWVEKQIQEMKGLKGKDLELKMGLFLFELSIQKATDFVRDELSRRESSFLDVDKYRFFHEITLLTFWAVKKVIGERLAIIDEIHRNYKESFNLIETFSETRDSLMRRYEIYSNSYDDTWGHQDILGLEIARFIFGNKEEILRPDITFWLISYVDDIIKYFEGQKKKWTDMGINL